MVRPEDLELDQILYNVVLYLASQEPQEAKDAAQLLVECELDEIKEETFVYVGDYGDEEWGAFYTLVILSAPYALHQRIGSSDAHACFTTSEQAYARKYPLLFEIERAFEAVLRQKRTLIQTYVQLAVESEGDWREYLRQVAKGERKTNQGRQFESEIKGTGLIVWQKLHFRSSAEQKIAEALDRREVLYLPNCAARLGPAEHRHNKEPDFLICHEGKWGILQVDGKEFHQQAALDHEWDRQFKRHGVRVVEHFTGLECMKDPDSVVGKFLDVLEKNG